ncbi:protein yellow [Homalodisca vitripennis]|uniref:protein yellow n=1 Tax=Homalodisca vitripennis TaxID=197043 RepID=UPI001EEA9AE3|nr:protein yellow [Homalodisca vitripennis]
MYVSALSVLVAAAVAGYADAVLKQVFHWRKLDFQYPDEASRNAAISSGEFVPENNLPLGLEVWKEKLFITIPRWKSGIPASLTYLDVTDSDNSPALRPYPDWASHKIYENDNTTKVISTFRIRVDECDRLWVLDTGLADILGKAEQLTPPKILIYDLITDKLIHQFLFDKAHIKDNSFFANIIVDVTPGKCEQAYAYIPDLGSYAVIVYNLFTDKSFRVRHHFFYMDPLSGNYNVGGVNFQWTDGIFSLALSPINKTDGSRTIYFHPLSSTMEFTVNSKILQNETIANDDYYAYKVLGTRGPHSQATASFLDPKTGVLFYTQINKNGVGCWNSFTHADDFSPETNFLVASDNETMIFPNDLKVDRDSNLWLLTDKLPTHIYKKLDFGEINYRVFTGPVDEIVKGTVCEVKDTEKTVPTQSDKDVSESTSEQTTTSTEKS